MPVLRRAYGPGGTFFFTLVTHRRQPLFRFASARRQLRTAFQRVRGNRPFEMPAIVLLPDHLHCLWVLPRGDADFSTRWRKIKETFTRLYLADAARTAAVPPAVGRVRRPDNHSCDAASFNEAPRSSGQMRKGLRGIWQQRFWEHTIRDDLDFRRHVDYIHFNPVKHGYARCAHDWPWSTYSQWLKAGFYEDTWCCSCGDARFEEPEFAEIAAFVHE